MASDEPVARPHSMNMSVTVTKASRHVPPIIATALVMMTLPEPTPMVWFSVLISIPAVYVSVWYGAMSPWRLIAIQSVLVVISGPNTVMRLIAVGLILWQVCAAFWTDGPAELKQFAVSFNIVAISRADETTISFGRLLLPLSVLVVGLVGYRKARVDSARFRKVIRRGGAFLAFALVGWGACAALALGSLREGQRSAEAALTALRVGDIDEARTHIEQSKSQLMKASSLLDSPISYPARFIPVLGFNRDTTVGVVQATSTALSAIGSELSLIDLESLKVVDGRLDLDAVASLFDPLSRSTDAVIALRTELDELRSPWNLFLFTDLLARLGEKLDTQITQGQNAVAAVDLAPELFGRDVRRTYFVALTTPVESRGHGGFMGSWLEVSLDDGKISVTDYGRVTDLNNSGSPVRRVLEPQDWLRAYGDFGFTTGPSGGVSKTAWGNITMSPHFDSTGAVITDLYPQSGGREIDGVFSMDVKTIAALLEFSGPVLVEGRDEPLTSENAEEFLLFEQYSSLATGDRVDLLEKVTRSAIDQILDGELPPPNVLANRLGPMVSEGRLTAYSKSPKVQEFFRRIKMSGEFRCDQVDDCFMVVADNASGSKIDYFLDIDSKVEFDFDNEQNVVTARVQLLLSNSAPRSGLPDYLIGNMVGLPPGFNRTLVSIHTSLFLDPLTSLDAAEWGARSEKDLNLYSTYTDLAPGQVKSIELVFKGRLDSGDVYKVLSRLPATARSWSTSFESVANSETFLVDEPGTKVMEFERGR